MSRHQTIQRLLTATTIIRLQFALSWLRTSLRRLSSSNLSLTALPFPVFRVRASFVKKRRTSRMSRRCVSSHACGIFAYIRSLADLFRLENAFPALAIRRRASQDFLLPPFRFQRRRNHPHSAVFLLTCTSTRIYSTHPPYPPRLSPSPLHQRRRAEEEWRKQRGAGRPVYGAAEGREGPLSSSSPADGAGSDERLSRQGSRA